MSPRKLPLQKKKVDAEEKAPKNEKKEVKNEKKELKIEKKNLKTHQVTRTRSLAKLENLPILELTKAASALSMYQSKKKDRKPIILPPSPVDEFPCTLLWDG